MKHREWDLDQDYPILEKWCKEYKWESVIPKDILPPQGIIVEDKDTITHSIPIKISQMWYC